jgi:outer membrane protein insertion porin family
MHTDRPAGRVRPIFASLACCAALALAEAPSAQAQAPLFLVDADTHVASIRLVFAETETLDRKVIRQRIALTEPGTMEGIRAFIDFLPFVRTPAPHPFSPLELGRDAVRIERFYEERGFHETDVAYEVSLDTAANAVDITFRIHEGRPLMLDTLALEVAGGMAGLDTAIARQWTGFVQSMHGETGIRIGNAERIRIRSRPLDWLRSRGYAFAQVEDTLFVDSAAATVAMHIRVEPAARARVDTVTMEGAQSLSYNTVRREIPIRTGDWYSAGEVAEGQRQVFGLGLVRLALFDVADDQPTDSTVSLHMRVQEAPSHLLSGELGYATERGAIAQGQWEHRDFLGSARSLTVSGVANTGWLAAGSSIDRRFGVSTAIRQPYVMHYRVSGTVRPFVEYRDDTRDESYSVGTDFSLLYERGALRQASATYTLSTRHIIDAPTRTARVDQPDTLLLSDAAVEVGNVGLSRLGLSLVFGEVDDPLDPHKGFVARASAEVAGPPAISSVEYGRLEASATGFIPLGRSFGLVAKLATGRLYPFGQSVPDSLPAVLPVLLRLRDAVFTAGGTSDVRGWGNGLLGPKVPDVRIIEDGDSLIVSANRYLVLSGLAKLTGSLELRMPFPLFGDRLGAHAFLDAGRVWTPDDRFFDTSLPRDPLGQEKVFYGTGAGIEFNTIVGPVRVDLGYKLNPSPLDLRNPDAVAKALVAGRPISSVPEESIKRWHLHLAIGRIY